MSETVKLRPVEMIVRVARLAIDAKYIADNMNGRDAVSVCLILEQARDDLSRVLERVKMELSP